MATAISAYTGIRRITNGMATKRSPVRFSARLGPVRLGSSRWIKREPSGGAHRHAGAGDVGQRRRHQQVDTRTLESPRQALDQ